MLVYCHLAVSLRMPNTHLILCDDVLPAHCCVIAFCHVSSNDSACDIFTVDEIIYHENPFVICDSSHQLYFTNPPPFWSLLSDTVFVRVHCDDGFNKMYAEVGPRRKGPMLDGSKLFDDVERMIIIETSDSYIVTFPSLRGLPKETALAFQNHQDAKWMVSVNPLLSLFEERCGMHLQQASSDSLKTMPKKLGFGRARWMDQMVGEKLARFLIVHWKWSSGP